MKVVQEAIGLEFEATSINPEDIGKFVKLGRRGDGETLHKVVSVGNTIMHLIQTSETSPVILAMDNYKEVGGDGNPISPVDMHAHVARLEWGCTPSEDQTLYLMPHQPSVPGYIYNDAHALIPALMRQVVRLEEYLNGLAAPEPNMVATNV